MDLFTQPELQRLAEQEADVCISIYMPTHRVESDWSQDTTRFKNRLRDARDQLREQGLREERIDEILEEARRRLDLADYWRQMSEGLAVFISPVATEFYRLPLSFEEVSVVDKRFHLKPLFPVIAANRRYYALLLGRSGARLYQGTHEAVSEVETIDMPSPVVRALQNGPSEQSSNLSAGSAEEEDSDESLEVASDQEITAFFQSVENRIQTLIGEEEAPLVLAGEDSYRTRYEQLCEHPHLLPEHVPFDRPEPPSPSDLHEKGWAIVAPVSEKAQNEEADRFEQLFYQDEKLASDDFHEIVPACAYGRVDTLFVPLGQHRWGRFDPSTNTVEMHEQRQPGDGDLLDYAAVRAHLNGATVHALPPEDMPGGRSVAATFRYHADVSAAEKG